MTPLCHIAPQRSPGRPKPWHAGRGPHWNWTPNSLVEQCAQHNAYKEKPRGDQILPLLQEKEGNLQAHSPLMVHFMLENHNDKRKGTEVQVRQAVAHIHLQNTIPSYNGAALHGAAQKSTYRLQPNT